MTETREAVKAQFEAEGMSIAEWARIRGFNVIAVYRVLSGKVQGTPGEAHRIAVALGLKEEPAELRFRDQEVA
jgi:gp16 family phage-associated protein